MKRIKGFTLIELIAVIAIITILSSILVPNVLGYMKKTHDAKAEDTGSLVFSSAMESYMESNNAFEKDNVEETLRENIKIKDIDFYVDEPSDDNDINIDLKYKNISYEVQVNAKNDTYIFTKK
ncbi:type IV pilin protein [Clostridium hydrogenum]|uniref:type IV pilin protein n=1 Tax=Clostridium hydrogenum TaxID=2855764 RepID=UPI001F3394AF|nr:type II secretion system protein [Clostridium hydrogenum]